METYKLKVKIGEHEFEAEGPTETVQAQFAAFRDLVTTLPREAVPAAPPTPAPSGDQPPRDAGKGELMLERIMRQEGRVVSLTVRAGSIEDEIMLVLLGQKKYRSNDSVTGGEIVDGLRLTGRQVKRVDYQLDKMTTAGDTITVGTGRARRYRLTNQGFARAQELAMALGQTVA